MGHLNGWWKCMNNPEVTMHDAQQSTGFNALDKATAAAGIAISLVMRVPAPLKSLADQVIRSASSVPANIAEGAGRSGRDRMHHYRIAYGSAKEVDTHLRLLIQARAIDNVRATTAIELFDDVRAITWRLLHPKP
jgi:four helix bundle protein